MVIGGGVMVIGEPSLPMYICYSEGHVIIREKRERERRKEEMNSQMWQRLGGRRRGSMVLGGAGGLGQHRCQQRERRSTVREQACVGRSQW